MNSTAPRNPMMIVTGRNAEWDSGTGAQKKQSISLNFVFILKKNISW
jgi:hypothetical protein